MVNTVSSSADISSTPAPALTLGSAASEYPPKLDIQLGEAVAVGDTLRLQAASDAAFIYKLFEHANAIGSSASATRAASVPGLASIARPAQTFFRARIERGTTQTAWSNIIKHGDTAPPTITSNAISTYAELAPLVHPLMAQEPVTWSIAGGRDGSQLEIRGATLRLSGNAMLDHEQQPDYQVIIRATDLAGNATDQAHTIRVSNIGEQANSFAFAPVKNAALANVYTSNVVTVGGLAPGVSIPVAITNGSYAKNDGPFANVGGTVTNGDRLVVRIRSSADFSTPLAATLSLGRGAEASTSSFSITTLADPQGVVWTVEATAPIRNVAYQEKFADFTNVNFGVGLGIVMISAIGRRIESCSIGGVSATLVAESGVRAGHASIWSVPISQPGLKTIRVAHATYALGVVAISAATLGSSAPAALQSAALEYGYYASPTSLGTQLVIPPHGFGLIVAVSETGTANLIWTGAFEGGSSKGGAGVTINHSFAQLTKTGTPTLAGLNWSGTGLAAAVWGPK